MPHKGKMCLLSRATAWDCAGRTLTAECDIAEDCLFYDPVLRGVPAWVGFEFMAQSVSALSGLCRQTKAEQPKLGVILTVSNLRIDRPILPAGKTVRIHVREDARDGNVIAFTGEIFLEDGKAMEAKLTVLESDSQNPEAVLPKEQK